jgi:hypothetical protein
MTKNNTQTKSQENSDFSEVQTERLTVLLTGYEQLNEEIRYFGQRLHTSYYLLISTTAVLIGLLVQKIIDLWLIFLLAGFIFVVTGYMMFRFRVKQRSGQVIRRRIEDKISKGNIDQIEKPLRIQEDVWANITRWEDFEESSLTQSRTDWDEFKRIRKQNLASAKVLSQVVIILGIVFLFISSYLLFTNGYFF